MGDLKIFQGELNAEKTEELKEKISSLFLMNMYNNEEEDYHQGIVKLTELRTWL